LKCFHFRVFLFIHFSTSDPQRTTQKGFGQSILKKKKKLKSILKSIKRNQKDFKPYSNKFKRNRARLFAFGKKFLFFFFFCSLQVVCFFFSKPPSVIFSQLNRTYLYFRILYSYNSIRFNSNLFLISTFQ